MSDEHPEITITQRLAQVGRCLLRWTAQYGLDKLHNPRDITGETGVPLGTVVPLLKRLRSADWARSELVDGHRLYALTKLGVEQLTEGLAWPGNESGQDDEPAPPIILPAVSARVWTMSELEKANPKLASVVRRKMGRAPH